MTITAIKQETESLSGAEYFARWVHEKGGAEVVGPMLGYTPGAVRHWCNGNRAISPERAVEFELKTKGELDRVALIFGTDFLC
jgi:DNA-binding transcriptional regulator YdaS (Cro superfamily)